jgi:hypothetical protein
MFYHINWYRVHLANAARVLYIYMYYNMDHHEFNMFMVYDV